MDPRLFDMARSGWRAIVGCAVGGALVAVLASMLLQSGTVATTVVAVSDDSVRAVGGDGLDVDELRQVIVAIAETEDTARLIAEEAGLGTADDLTVVAESETRSPVITLSVTASSDERALAAADAAATVLGRERQRILSDALRTSIGRTQAEVAEGLDRVSQLRLDLEALDQQRASAANPTAIERFDRERSLLDQELLQVSADVDAAETNLDLWEETAVAAGGSVTQVEHAEISDAGPAPVGVALVGLAAGAVGAFGYLVLAEERRRVRRERFAAGMAGDDVTRWVLDKSDEPEWVTLAERGAELPLPRADELMGYRGVLASVLLPSTSVIAVAGVEDYDGSGATAISLAHAYAGAGRNVVLVSTKVPPLSTGAEELENGLHAYLTENAALDDVLIGLEARHGDLRYLPPGGLSGVEDLASRTEELSELMRELTAAGADLVILELPPLLSQNAAVSLCRLTHGVVLSTVSGSTTNEARDRVARRLRIARSAVIGEITHEDHLPRPIFVRASEEQQDEGELIDLRTHVLGA